MDHLTTQWPPTSPSMPHTGLRVCLSKSAVVQMIQDIPFDEISIPQNTVHDQPESTAAFLRAVGLALIDILIRNSPDKATPQRLLSGTMSFHCYDSGPNTPTKQSRFEKPNLVATFSGI